MTEAGKSPSAWEQDSVDYQDGQDSKKEILKILSILIILFYLRLQKNFARRFGFRREGTGSDGGTGKY